MSKEIAEMHEKIATRNAQSAVNSTAALREEFEEFRKAMTGIINDQQFRIADLTQKYNLLLTQRFNGGSTEE